MLKRVIGKLNGKTVILASSSPRRKEILEKVGLICEICPSDFEENLRPSDFPSIPEYVEATALGKVNDVYEKLIKLGKPADLIVGADTMVTLDGKMFGKPKTNDEAFKTLKTLSGKPHIVYTSVALRYGPKVVTFTENTTVYIGQLSDEEINAYVETDEPLDKAGGYGIQGIGSCIVERIEGDYFTVMGLPLYKLTKELSKLIL